MKKSFERRYVFGNCIIQHAQILSKKVEKLVIEMNVHRFKCTPNGQSQVYHEGHDCVIGKTLGRQKVVHQFIKHALPIGQTDTQIVVKDNAGLLTKEQIAVQL